MPKTSFIPTESSADGVPLADVMKALEGRGFEAVKAISGSTYKDSSTVIIVPTRGKLSDATLSPKFTSALYSMIAPMNQKRAILFSCGNEVGHAYNELIKSILDNPELSKWKYVMTIEDDNLVPMDAHVRLLESIDAGPFDAVSGIYFTKGQIQRPMAYGDPQVYARTGVLDFKPLDIRTHLAGGHIMPVNGIAMGCALWRMDLYRQIPAPWYCTVADVVEGKGPMGFTQDLYFCKNAVERGKKFAVDLRVRVGHLDMGSGIVY
jgi:hypothetical protein